MYILMSYIWLIDQKLGLTDNVMILSNNITGAMWKSNTKYWKQKNKINYWLFTDKMKARTNNNNKLRKWRDFWWIITKNVSCRWYTSSWRIFWQLLDMILITHRIVSVSWSEKYPKKVFGRRRPLVRINFIIRHDFVNFDSDCLSKTETNFGLLGSRVCITNNNAHHTLCSKIGKVSN